MGLFSNIFGIKKAVKSMQHGAQAISTSVDKSLVELTKSIDRTLFGLSTDIHEGRKFLQNEATVFLEKAGDVLDQADSSLLEFQDTTRRIGNLATTTEFAVTITTKILAVFLLILILYFARRVIATFDSNQASSVVNYIPKVLLDMFVWVLIILMFFFSLQLVDDCLRLYEFNYWYQKEIAKNVPYFYYLLLPVTAVIATTLQYAQQNRLLTVNNVVNGLYGLFYWPIYFAFISPIKKCNYFWDGSPFHFSTAILLYPAVFILYATAAIFLGTLIVTLIGSEMKTYYIVGLAPTVVYAAFCIISFMLHIVVSLLVSCLSIPMWIYVE